MPVSFSTRSSAPVVPFVILSHISFTVCSSAEPFFVISFISLFCFGLLSQGNYLKIGLKIIGRYFIWAFVARLDGRLDALGQQTVDGGGDEGTGADEIALHVARLVVLVLPRPQQERIR